MRWLFLLLLTLNIFYYVWSHQQLPGLAQTVSSFSLHAGEQGHIQLLSEEHRRRAPAYQSGGFAALEICLFLGGFEGRENALALEQRLLSLDILSDVHGREVKTGVDYWVYLAPLSSREVALRQLNELQSRAIDSYLITQGELANGISLGIFSRDDSARSVLERMRGIGYPAELQELKRTTQAYWVQVVPQSGSAIGDDLLERLARDFPGLQQQQNRCENAVATAQ